LRLALLPQSEIVRVDPIDLCGCASPHEWQCACHREKVTSFPPCKGRERMHFSYRRASHDRYEGNMIEQRAKNPTRSPSGKKLSVRSATWSPAHARGLACTTGHWPVRDRLRYLVLPTYVKVQYIKPSIACTFFANKARVHIAQIYRTTHWFMENVACMRPRTRLHVHVLSRPASCSMVGQNAERHIRVVSVVHQIQAGRDQAEKC